MNGITVREMLDDLFSTQTATRNRLCSPRISPFKTLAGPEDSPNSPNSPALNARPHRGFWGVFGLGGPCACWRVTGADGQTRVVAVDPVLTLADMALNYGDRMVEQLFSEGERAQMLAATKRSYNHDSAS